MGNWGYFSPKSVEDLVSIYKPLKTSSIPNFPVSGLSSWERYSHLLRFPVDRLNKFKPFLQIDEEYHGRT